MAYNPWSVVNFEQPDVNKWNELGSNDAFFYDSLNSGKVSFTGLSLSRIFTLPDANATLARTDAGQTFTGVNTFTSPKILTDISDTNGNELLKVIATASAVNEVTITNAAIGGSPTLSATGDDTNIDLILSSKGTGSVYTSNSLFVGNKTLSTATCQVQIGSGRTGDGFSLIDLVGDATYTDYGLRIIRINTGANTASRILHKGTGDFDIWGEEASKIRFLTSGTERVTIDSTGIATFTENAIFNKLGAQIKLSGTGQTDWFIGSANSKIYITDYATSAIGVEINQTSGIMNFLGTFGNSTKNPETQAETDWLEIKLNGVQYFIPLYTA